MPLRANQLNTPQPLPVSFFPCSFTAHSIMKRHLRLVLCGFAFVAAVGSFAAEKLELRDGDHIAIIGNTLADRMQHSGYFEALTHEKFPKHALVFRNLAFSADEVAVRPRSENFGTPDEWLTKVQADVVLAFFGFNESFKGAEGLPKFRDDLDKFLKDALKANYSGKGAPRVVLFSPIAHENLKNPDFPDGEQTNDRLRYYVEAMQQTAKANGVQFVNLFAPSKEAYTAAKTPLTVNGIH